MKKIQIEMGSKTFSVGDTVRWGVHTCIVSLGWFYIEGYYRVYGIHLIDAETKEPYNWDNLELSEDFEVINKPVQTTKEQPTHNIIKRTDKIIDVHYLETQTQINFEGFSLHLKHDGTFYFTDVVG